MRRKTVASVRGQLRNGGDLPYRRAGEHRIANLEEFISASIE